MSTATFPAPLDPVLRAELDGSRAYPSPFGTRAKAMEIGKRLDAVAIGNLLAGTVNVANGGTTGTVDIDAILEDRDGFTAGDFDGCLVQLTCQSSTGWGSAAKVDGEVASGVLTVTVDADPAQVGGADFAYLLIATS